MNPTDQPSRWYVMSATFNRSLKVREYLDERGIESFIPLRTQISTLRGKKVKKEIPAISNIIFIRTTEDELKRIKQSIAYLHFMMVKTTQGPQKMVIRDDEMAHFIRCCTQTLQKVTYLAPDEVHLKKGTRVRIHGGPLNGMEGYFVKVKGIRNKCVVVKLDHIAAAALTDVHPDLIEVIT